MNGLVSPRSDLFTLSQVARSLNMSRDKLSGIMIGLGINSKTDPARPHCTMLDQNDIERICDVSGRKVG